MTQLTYQAYTDQNKPMDFVPTVAGAGCCILVNNHVLLLQRSATHRLQPSTWGIPAGKIDPGETPEQAAIRETQEEAGITISESIMEYRGPLFIEVVGTYPAKIAFHVYTVYLQQHPAVALEPDQVAFCWVTREEALQLPIFTGTREVLELGMREG
jgi:mutator protein MutT